ncbi:MAG: hypothetical protein Q8754_02895, partial [Sweet potato little leaf phytoplasma]|nr:hypothetical protein [Sweet potato little leaf phytoplasma]
APYLGFGPLVDAIGFIIPLISCYVLYSLPSMVFCWSRYLSKTSHNWAFFQCFHQWDINVKFSQDIQEFLELCLIIFLS